MADPEPAAATPRYRRRPRRENGEKAAVAYSLVAGTVSFGAGALAGMLLADVVGQALRLAVTLGVTFGLILLSALYADALAPALRRTRR